MTRPQPISYAIAPSEPIWPIVLGYALVFAAALIAMSPLFSAQFVSMDDWGTISRNANLLTPTASSLARYWAAPFEALYVPVTYSLWWLLASITRDLSPAPAPMNPAWFHATNVSLHACTSLLIAGIIRRLLKNDWAAIVGGLLFALHPLQVETVGWASGTKDLLAGFFGALTVWLYLLGLRDTAPERPRAFLHVAAIVTFALALLSKPSAMTIPAILVLLDRWLTNRRWRRIFISIIPFTIMSIATMISAWIFQPALRATPAPLWMRPLMVGDALTFYLWKLFLPIHLAPVYGRTLSFLAHDRWLYFAWIIPVALAILLGWKRRTCSPLAIAAAIFVLSLSPMIGLFRFDFQYYSTVADHYVYFAMLGPALAAGFLFSHSAIRTRQTAIIAIVLLITAATLTFRQSQFWRNDETLYTHSLAVAPDGVLVLHNFANLRMREGRLDEAVAMYRHAVEIEPRHYESLGAVATIVSRQGNIEEGDRLFEQFLQQEGALPDTLRPKQYSQHVFTYASTLLHQNNREKAIHYFKLKLQLDPNDSAAQHGLEQAEALPRFGL